MPAAIAYLATLAASIATSGSFLAGTIYAGVYGALSIGLSLGLSFLASALIPKPQSPKPEDVQQSTRQPLAPRYRHYGRVKTSGSWVFAESNQGNFYKVLALGQGPIDAFEEFWIDDNIVNVVSSSVPTLPYDNKVRIQTRVGGSSLSHYSDLTAVFPAWTSNHLGKGVASLFATQLATTSKRYLKTFPNGINTNYRVVMRGVMVKNPVTGVTAWSDNAASIIRDYLYHEDGLRLPESLLTTPLAQAGWEAAFNKAATAYNLKGGGTEARYRLWGSYSLEERPADVLSRMLASCDGQLKVTPDAGLTLDVGDWQNPSVTIDSSMIVGVSDLGRGRDVLTTANTIRATFLNPAQDYQSSDADPWVDAADVSLRGEIAQDTSFIMSPSHSQARRLMKVTSYRTNPNWVGIFVCNLKALQAFGERFVRITYPRFGIDEVFEVQDFKFDISENGILRSVTLQVASMPQAAYNWNANEEEGTAPVSDETEREEDIPVPTGFNVTIQRKTIGGALVPYGLLTFDAPPSEALLIEAQGKRTADVDWTPIAVAEGATQAESFVLSDGEEYEFQIRHVTYSTNASDWTASIVITAIADPTAPAIITNLIATPGVGQVAFTWDSPNSSNFSATNIYRNTINDEGTATLIRTEYGSPSSSFVYTNTGLAAGTYYYWFRARNASGVESASVASGSQVVT